MAHKDVKDIIALLRAQGWKCEIKSKSCHWRLASPDGKTLLFHGTTPSAHSAHRNWINDLRRAGAKIP